jgi:hypothetical protein
MSLIYNDFLSFVYDNVKNIENKYSSVNDLPLTFYDFYKDNLIKFKDIGMSKQEMIDALTQLYMENDNIAEFIYEILDLVYGYCSPKYKIFED